MKTQPVIGISGCLTGAAVRFDGGHKRTEFVMDRLAQWVTFRPVCPEMAIGLSVPRPALRLVQTAAGEIRMRLSHTPHEDVTGKMADFCEGYLTGLGELSGFIVCAKSPSCGMERVRLYDEKGNRGRKEGVGLFTAALMEKYPWLPVEEDGRLHDPILRENFVERVFALHALNTLRKTGLTRRAILDFHSRYKLQLLAHHQAGYREIGPFVATLHEWEDLDAFFAVYRDKLMTILKKPASRKNHTNVLMHIQGYFRNQLTMRQRGELREVILNYRAGLLPILAPMTLLKHYLAEYQDAYLLTQNYFDPYPQALALRLTIQ
ncbi:TPA: YbgA family protein [Serratia marcescens]